MIAFGLLAPSVIANSEQEKTRGATSKNTVLERVKIPPENAAKGGHVGGTMDKKRK